MRLSALIPCFVLAGLCAADQPFPNTPKNRWVYGTLWAIKKDHLWYRVNDSVPHREVPTRMDLATKTFYLALDSKDLIDSFQNTAQMVSVPAGDPASKKWARNFVADFPKRKKLYATHLQRVEKLWHFFRPEVLTVAKRMKVDPVSLGKRLAAEKAELNGVKLAKPVALDANFPDVPSDHWAAKAVLELKTAGILAGYPAGS